VIGREETCKIFPLNSYKITMAKHKTLFKTTAKSLEKSKQQKASNQKQKTISCTSLDAFALGHCAVLMCWSQWLKPLGFVLVFV